MIVAMATNVVGVGVGGGGQITATILRVYGRTLNLGHHCGSQQ
jgi:hypothetical protein